MNKLLSGVPLFLFSCISTACFAMHPNYKGEIVAPAPCLPPCPVLNEGVYVGVGLGYDAYRIRQSFRLLDAMSNINSGDPVSTANGANGSLFLGYGRYFDWFYFAGEVMANMSRANADYTLQTSALTYHTDIDVRASYGAGLLPGIKLTESTMFYGRIGYVRTYIKATEYGVGATAFSNAHTDWFNGLSFGLGFETAMTNNIGVRGEFTHTAYDSSTSLLGTKFSPSNNQVVASLLYHFG